MGPLQAGTADPLDFRYARKVGGTADTLKAGAVLANATDVQVVAAIAGALAFRLRGLFTASGTLKFYYLRPGAERAGNTIADAYDPTVGPALANVAVVGNTSFVADVTPTGESELLIIFTPSGAGVVTYLDGMQQ